MNINWMEDTESLVFPGFLPFILSWPSPEEDDSYLHSVGEETKKHGGCVTYPVFHPHVAKMGFTSNRTHSVKVARLSK